MKIRETVNLILTALLLPFCFAWFFEVFPSHEHPLLYTAIVCVTAVLVLALIIHNLYWFSYRCQPLTRLRCFFITRLADRPVKKLRRVITKSRNLTVVETALAKLRETAGKEQYLAIVKDSAEKQKDEGKKKYLQKIYEIYITEEKQ